MPDAPVSDRPRVKGKDFDPEQYRMTIGEHLEELRRRLILGLIGLGVAVLGCMLIGERIIVIFCAPLITALQERGINAQLYYNEVAGAFMTYLKVCLIAALAVAGPWIVYQLWLFVAAGLYPHERKTITRYIPLSLTLLVSGMVFVYFVVLPVTVGVLIDFGSGIPMPRAEKIATTAPSTQPTQVARYDGDPAHPIDGEIWLNTHDRQLKIYLAGEVRNIVFGPRNLVAPLITLSSYIDLVITSMVMFGLCFQLPLVMLALAKVNIVNPATFRKSRRIVYFILAVVAAFVAPGDVVMSMMMLLVPLLVLYEMGIILSAWSLRKAQATEP